MKEQFSEHFKIIDEYLERNPQPSALDVQVAGSHYKDKKIQPVQYIHANGLGRKKMTNTDIIRKSFEAIMLSKGRIELKRKGAGYESPNIQTKWRYFLLGWTISRSGT